MREGKEQPERGEGGRKQDCQVGTKGEKADKETSNIAPLRLLKLLFPTMPFCFNNFQQRKQKRRNIPLEKRNRPTFRDNEPDSYLK